MPTATAMHSAARLRGERRNPYVFVVGCPRSGTTLLQRMLDAHPDLAVTNDTHFIPAVVPRDAAVDTPLTPDLVERVSSYRRFHRLELPTATVAAVAGTAPTYAAFVSSLYDAVADRRGKALAGEKTPDYVRRLPMLSGLFPSARFVHIIRDGRDVALSALDWATPTKGPGRFAMWNEEPVAVAALWWQRMVTKGCRNGPKFARDRYGEVRYEELVTTPTDVLRGVTDFLGLPFSPAMERFNEGKERPLQPGRSAKRAWVGPTTGLREWRTALSERDIALFEVLAGGLLQDLGYECVSGRPSSKLRATAERVREGWKARAGS